MLVLSRYSGEKIKIGDNVMITIVSVEGDKVRIGIDAPKDVPILRTEIIKPTGGMEIKEGSK